MRTRDTFDVMCSTLAVAADALAVFAGFILAVWIRFDSGWIPMRLEVMPPRDLYLVAENRIVRDFLQSLFPPKGYLPAPALVAAQSRLPD